MFDFSDKVAIVTGGAAGIGEATARLFAGAGASVVIADRDLSRAQRVSDEIGEHAVAIEVDVADPDSTKAMVNLTEQTFGGLDILINNAGISSPKSAIESSDIANFDRVFAVNVRGVYLCTRQAVPALRRRGGGVILNTSSVAALVPRRGSAMYAASKSAVVTLTKALSLELAPDIRVNCVCPAPIDTDFMASVFTDEVELARFRARLYEKPEQTTPLGRVIEPVDVAHAFAFLASDTARTISGVVLPIDGARSAGDHS